MKQVVFSKNFKKDYSLTVKREKDPKKFEQILNLLVNDLSIPQKFKDHKLKGNYVGYRDLHIEPDWVLIYKINSNSVSFIRTGTHSDLFKK